MIHAGFRTSRTVVLHKFGTDPNYDSWRSQALSSSGPRNSRLGEYARSPGATPLRSSLVNGKCNIQHAEQPCRVSILPTVVQSVANAQADEIRQARHGNWRLRQTAVALLHRLTAGPRRESRRSGRRYWRATHPSDRRPSRRPVHCRTVATQPDGALRARADRRHSRRGHRGSRQARGQKIARDAGAGQPPQGRSDRPSGLEGADDQRRRVRLERLRGRARPRGPRPSPGRSPASPEVSHDRPRPDMPTSARRWSLTSGACPGPSSAGHRLSAEAKHLGGRQSPVRERRLCGLPHGQAGRRRGDLQRPAAPRHGPGDGRRRFVCGRRLRRR